MHREISIVSSFRVSPPNPEGAFVGKDFGVGKRVGKDFTHTNPLVGKDFGVRKASGRIWQGKGLGRKSSPGLGWSIVKCDAPENSEGA